MPSDPLYQKAVAHVTETGNTSICSLQRYLKIGYNHAYHLIKKMENEGIVSTHDAFGKRKVLKNE